MKEVKYFQLLMKLLKMFQSLHAMRALLDPIITIIMIFILCMSLREKLIYFFIDNKTKDIKYIKVKVGETIFTPKNEIHSTYFPKKTKMVVGSKFSRDKETYETDTVRVPFVTLENVNDMLRRYGD